MARNLVKVRLGILNYVRDKKDWVYIRQIAKHLEVPRGTIGREARKLVAEGLLKERKQKSDLKNRTAVVFAIADY